MTSPVDFNPLFYLESVLLHVLLGRFRFTLTAESTKERPRLLSLSIGLPYSPPPPNPNHPTHQTTPPEAPYDFSSKAGPPSRHRADRLDSLRFPLFLFLPSRGFSTAPPHVFFNCPLVAISPLLDGAVRDVLASPYLARIVFFSRRMPCI